MSGAFLWRRFILLFFLGGAEAQRTAICMAKASDFIQHGEGIFGLNYSGEQEFGAIISSVSYSWSAKGDVELTGDKGLMGTRFMIPAVKLPGKPI